MADLEREIATFNSRLPELLSNIGKFLLIKEDEILGTYEAYSDVLQAGYDRTPEGGFLVKKIAPAEQVSFFTRDLQFACQV